jgi:hypothetical protein
MEKSSNGLGHRTLKLMALNSNTERSRRYRQAHPERWRAAYQNYRRNNPVRCGFGTLVCVARRRGIECTLRFEEYKTLRTLPCFYCGGVLPKIGHGLDRVDSNLGYSLGNVRPCCTQCNRAKSDLTESEFRQWVERLWSHWAGGE